MTKKSDTVEIIELIEALGFERDFVDTEQKRIRFQSEESFIDVWTGKKGVTVGIYDSETKSMRYHRKATLSSIEDILT